MCEVHRTGAAPNAPTKAGKSTIIYGTRVSAGSSPSIRALVVFVWKNKTGETGRPLRCRAAFAGEGTCTWSSQSPQTPACCCRTLRFARPPHYCPGLARSVNKSPNGGRQAPAHLPGSPIRLGSRHARSISWPPPAADPHFEMFRLSSTRPRINHMHWWYNDRLAAHSPDDSVFVLPVHIRRPAARATPCGENNKAT